MPYRVWKLLTQNQVIMSIFEAIIWGLIRGLTAFVSGFLACKRVIEIVKKGKPTYCAAYCFIAGVITIYLGTQ